MKKLHLLVFSIIIVISISACADTTVGIKTQLQSSRNAPEDYISRFTGDYSDKNYSTIKINDSNGNDISNIVIDLWYAANEVYNVDDGVMFETGEGVKLYEDYPDFIELKNYNDVVDKIFTANARKQVEETCLSGGEKTFIQKKDGKVYRLGPWRTGNSYAHALKDIQLKEATQNSVVVTVEYEKSGRIFYDDENYGYPPEYDSRDFKIIKEGNIWVVENYIYPDTNMQLK